MVGKIVDKLFDDAAFLVGKQDIKSVLSRLRASQKVAMYGIKRNEVSALVIMRSVFKTY